MADYISRTAAIAAFESSDADVREQYPDGYCDWGFGRKAIESTLENVPAADVEPVRHGVWENTSKMYGVYSGRCSVCKLGSGMWHINQPYRFCPFCGARLKLEGKKK